ncbi:hypothetical protein [Actinomadura flavalba]|uniref:hypothetical protein n=1 Tax=Actinomadura flavalba TaxID=1120938 RepID=UPI000377B799|nr:hypothetical protein [Actinomadura flavalba]
MVTESVRRRLAAVCLLLYGVLLFLGFVTGPDGAEHVPAVFRAEAATVQLSAVLLHWAIVALVAALVGLAPLLRGSVVATIGWGAAFLGYVNASGLLVGDFYDLALAQKAPDAVSTAVMDTAGGLPGFVFGFLLPAFLSHLGMLAVLVVLVRRGFAPWWTPVAVVAGIVLPFVVAGQASAVQAVGPLVQLAGYAALAARLLRAPVTAAPRPVPA